MKKEDQFDEEEFKRLIINHVKEGKYARALNLLNTRVQGLLLVEAVKQELNTQDTEKLKEGKNVI